MLGDKVKQRRLELGLTQKQLAGDDLSREYISQIESGKRNPSQEILKIIAGRLTVSLDYFEIESPSEKVLKMTEDVLALVQNDVAKATELARVAFGMASSIHNGPVKMKTALVLSQILMQDKKLDEAREILEAMLALPRGKEDREIVFEILLTTGNVLYKMGNYKRAARYYYRGFVLSKGYKRSQAVHLKCAIFLGSSLFRLGKFERAKHFYHEAIELGILLNEQKLTIDSFLGYGMSLHELGLTREALKVTRKAIHLSKDNHNYAMTQLIHNTAVFQRSIHIGSHVNQILNELLNKYAAEHDITNQVRIMEELSLYLVDCGDLESATHYLSQAVHLLPRVDNDILCGRIYRRLANVLKLQDKSTESELYYQLALGYFRKVDAEAETEQILEILNAK